MAINFWDKKNKFRKSLSLSNKTLLILEKIEEDDKKSFNKEFEEMLKTSPKYEKILDELKEDYPDIDEN